MPPSCKIFTHCPVLWLKIAIGTDTYNLTDMTTIATNMAEIINDVNIVFILSSLTILQ